MKSKRAFTLIELLVVIAIIAILAVLVSSAAGTFQKKAQMAQSISNMKQLASGFLTYTGQNDNQFPQLGLSEPGWGPPARTEDKQAWYYSVLRAAGSRGLDEYEKPDEFYQKKNLVYLPAAKYPSLKTGRPYFAIAINELLYGDETTRQERKETGSTPRLANMVAPAQTVVFLEVGLPDEDNLPGQNPADYIGLASGGPRNVVARYQKTSSTDLEDRRSAVMNFVFGDGHAENMPAKDALDISGRAYSPQLQKDGGKGKVSWTLDPESKVPGE